MARSAKRGKQGKRLGEWVYLSKDAFLGWLERTRTTHGALAQELGVSAGLVSSWKAGRRFPSEVNQRKLAELVERAAREPREGGRGLALGAGGDDAELVPRDVSGVVVLEDEIGDAVEEAELPGDGGVVAHRAAEEEHAPAVAAGGLEDGLHAVDVRGELGDDDAVLKQYSGLRAYDNFYTELFEAPGSVD